MSTDYEAAARSWEAKYENTEMLRHLNVLGIEDADECAYLMQRYDEAIAECDASVSMAKARAFARGHYMPPEAFVDLGRRLKDYKRKRAATQERRGFLVRQRKRDQHAATMAQNENMLDAFFRHARATLKPETFHYIQERARQDISGEAPRP